MKYLPLPTLIMLGTVLLLYTGCGSPPKDPLQGCWTLDQWFVENPDQSIAYPYGKDARGELCLHGDRLWLTLSHRDRNLLGDLNRNDIPDSLIAASARTYFHYSGTYTLTDSILQLKVEYCNVPDWEGATLNRILRYSDGQITLLSPGVGNDKHTLRWSKTDLTE